MRSFYNIDAKVYFEMKAWKLRSLWAGVVLAATIVGAKPLAISPQLAALIDTERKFSARAAEVGVRDSFLEYFADDVVTFADQVNIGKQQLLARPAVARPPRMILHWEPQVGTIADSGDLGWLSGPVTLTDRTQELPTRHFWYFSIWKKQASGDWKVAVDIGVDLAQAGPQNAFEVIDADRRHKAGERATLSATEDELARMAAEQSEQAAICKFAAERFLVVRAGEMPTRDRASGCKIVPTNKLKFQSRELVLSAARDLAYSWGDYQQDSDGQTQKGNYVRIWRHTDKGWQIVAYVNRPLGG